VNADPEELLDKDVASVTDAEVDYLRETEAERFAATVERIAGFLERPGCVLDPEVAYFLARLKSPAEVPVTAEQLMLDLALVRLVPRSLSYYKDRAEQARRPTQGMSTGVQP
jgi:hypothetical protein